MKASFKADDPGAIEFEATFKMPLHQWGVIRAALMKGKEEYYGPARWMIDTIDEMVRQAEKNFEPKAAP